MKRLAVAVFLLLALTLSAAAAPLQLNGSFSTEFLWTPEAGVVGHNTMATSFRLGGLPNGMTLTFEGDPSTVRNFWDAPRFSLNEMVASSNRGRVVYYSLSTSGALWADAAASTVVFGNYGVNLGNEFYNRNFQWSDTWRQRNEQLRGVRVTNIDLWGGKGLAFYGHAHTIYNANAAAANTHRYSPHYGLQWEGTLLGSLALNSGFATYTTPKLVDGLVANVVVTNLKGNQVVSVPRQNVNKARETDNLILYRDPWGQPAYTGTNEWGLEVVFEPTAVPNHYRVVSVATSGVVHRHLIPAGGFALSGHGAGSTALTGLNAVVGDIVKVDHMEFLFTPAKSETIAMASGKYTLPMSLGSVDFRGGYLSTLNNDLAQPVADGSYAVKVDGSLDLKSYVPLTLFTVKGGYREVQKDFTPAYMYFNSAWHTTDDNVAANAPFEYMRGEQGWNVGTDLGIANAKFQVAFNTWTSDFASRKRVDVDGNSVDSWNFWTNTEYTIAGWNLVGTSLRSNRITAANAVTLTDSITARAKGNVATLPLEVRYNINLRNQGPVDTDLVHNQTIHTVDLVGTTIAEFKLAGQYKLTDSVLADDRYASEAWASVSRGWRLDGWAVDFTDKVEWWQATSKTINTAGVTAAKRVDIDFLNPRMRLQSNYGLQVVNTFITGQDVATVLKPTASWSTSYDIWKLRRVGLEASASADVRMTGAEVNKRYIGDYLDIAPRFALKANYAAPIGLTFEGGVAWPNTLNTPTSTFFKTTYSVNF